MTNENPLPQEPTEYDANAALRAYAAQGMRECYLKALAEPDGLITLGLNRIVDAGHFVDYAFNLRNNPECPYTFPEDVRGRAAELLYEIFLLWKDNKHRLQLRTGALAGKDPAFQRFMASAAQGRKRPSRRVHGKGGAHESR